MIQILVIVVYIIVYKTFSLRINLKVVPVSGKNDLINNSVPILKHL